ncbi:Histone-lysine N-methyltransferase, H3 lysine-36 and H4 lysine-20 specific,Histone-lysine N-methyltransferase NSD2,Histone-lysine N-methyltransferase NSD3 [Mytilus edulis]|uniref:Histone-lysine N-methyltransferase, H3 lysine-36 and H4 lysine-20 specific,Histone-lysine N-methyltransferase NSD2,Histone-lysine N-methyltransferase NSD3 n=1 Tax=Mytilus edulis TaxID=6550 RepID=A0A8S3PQ18_MYTED|nr:Histone-lysine N-methyltransferase, H3 lysine-36 and H4 lysine-20 specific,Histone-lysine N-methyltransferase NSD2,Histone-lysine N-methyltransferase NSD3 [Mytilus edulis]
MNGTSQAPSGFRHILPQIPTMNRNPKIAQSKASAKKEVGSPPGNVGAKLVVEDASKVVTMDVDLKQEPSEELKQEGVPKENEELVENEKSKESDKSPPTSAVSTLDPDKNQKKKKSELKASKSPEKSEQRAQKSPEKKGGSYKNIFDDKVVEVVEEEKPVEWLVGDCLWGKVAGHPWWPCMVSFDPHTGIYTKMQGKSRMYHMQYFGDECERGWVYSSSVMEFKGKKDYDEHKNKDTMMEEHPGFTEEMLADLMKQQWCMMSQKQKARYKSKFASDEPGAKKKQDVHEEEEVTKKKKSSQKSTEPEEHEKPEKVPKVKRSKSVKESKPVVSDQVEPMETEETGVPNEEDQDNSKSAAPKPTGLENEEPEFEILKLASSGPQKAEKICQICEKDGDLLDCTGACLGTFHANCLGLKDTAAENFKCDECTTGNHTCFKCKKADTNTRKCGVVQCGKFYHEDCVKSLQYAKCENKNFTCPLHACESCCAEQTKKDKSSKGARLLRCVRCPTAYHVGEFCIGAGSLNLPGYNIVCPKHFKPSKSNKAVHSHVNVSWCFSCNNGGSLICCESCPAAFHADCVKIKSTEGSFYCAECAAGKRPLYGDIVWVKLGTYRWWPCQVCHPANVPHNIQHKAHGVGEFPVQFFGSKDYYWIHKGRCFAFQEGDKASKENTANKHLAKIFSKGVYEATEAFKVWKAVKANKEQVEKERQDRKPAPFKYVKTNLPIGSVQIYKADLTEIPRCECKPEQDNPCSSDTDCLNRMLMYECHPAVCPAGEKCQNQRYQKTGISRLRTL